MIRRLLFVLVLVGFAAGLAVGGLMRTTAETRADGPPAPTPAPEPRPDTSVSALITGGPDFTGVASQAVRGVANISSLQVVRRSNSPFANDPFFRYFFGDDDTMFGPRDRRSLSLGSGVIVSSDGYVVTNSHVVGENSVREITIALPDKREIRGKVIGTDPATDIALLKINATGLSPVAWGDSDQLKLGEWVLAIGSPFQLNQTVTAGIVSATGRANLGFAEYEDFIQTDAAINPGNSGGALVNARGELVGINTGIFSQSGGYQGIGFAVPSRLARHIVDELMKYGEVRRGTVGGILSIDKLTPQFAEEIGARSTNGALIVRMTRNSESYEAGIRPGDVITGFNGQAVDDPAQFMRMVADARIGSTATLKVLREGRTFEVKIPIVARRR